MQGASFKYCYNYSPFGARLPGRTYDYRTASNLVHKYAFTTTNVANDWLVNMGSGFTKVLEGTRLKFTATPDYAGVYRTFNTTPGKTYRIKAKVDLNNTGALVLVARDEQGNNHVTKIAYSSNWYELTFVATTATSRIHIEGINFGNGLSKTFYLDEVVIESIPSEGDYRFGFNGKELDQEGLGGGGSTYDYGFRIYNAQLGKFLSVDPLTSSYPWYTPYQFAGNKPIAAIDLDGLEELIVIRFYDNDGQYTGELTFRVPDKDRVEPADGGALYVNRPESERERIKDEVSKQTYQHEFFKEDANGKKIFVDGHQAYSTTMRNKKDVENNTMIKESDGRITWDSHRPYTEKIYFDQNSSEFKETITWDLDGKIIVKNNESLLVRSSTYLQDNPDFKPVIVGTANTDNQTGNFNNQDLSKARAQTAADQLSSRGVSVNPSDIKGNGTSNIGNTPTEKKLFNRNATITYIPK